MLEPITKQTTDNSTNTEFSFSFYCENCSHEWRSIPISFNSNDSEEPTTFYKKEHEAAYERANREAMMYFNRCPVCKRWVCDDCFIIYKDGYICKECLKLKNSTNEFSKDDIEKNKVMAGLAYIIFFLPLFVCPNSNFAKFHANQSLLLLIIGVLGGTLLAITSLMSLTTWILPIFLIAILVVAVKSMLMALNGKSIELPLIGRIKLIK